MKHTAKTVKTVLAYTKTRNTHEEGLDGFVRARIELLAIVPLPLQRRKCKVNDQDEHEQHASRPNQCTSMQISRIAHLKNNIGGHSTNTVGCVRLFRFGCARSIH